MDEGLEPFLKSVKRESFDNLPYIKKIVKPWGFELHFTPEGLPYMGKILHINSGKRLSLQVHDKKTESWFKLSGKVILVIENKNGELEELEMEDGLGYTTKLGQKHRLVGVSDSDILEVSSPEIGNTYRLEDDYSRPTETEEVRKDPNRGWNN